MSKNLRLTPEISNYSRQMRSRAHDPVLAELRKETETKFSDYAQMLVSEEQGDFFTVLVGALQVKSALEIGTFTGYSSTCIARGLAPGGKLLCCDVSEEWTNVARHTWKRAGVDDRIELRLAPAADTLAKLEPGLTFDFVFIDADKTGYDAYYELVLPRVKRNGLIVFDNMLGGGAVIAPTDERSRALDALNRKLATDQRVDAVLLPAADGLQFCRKL